jgi:hypothetical protein
MILYFQAYVTTLIDSNEGIKRGAIVGTGDGAIWAKSEGGAQDFKVCYLRLFIHNDYANCFRQQKQS